MIFVDFSRLFLTIPLEIYPIEAIRKILRPQTDFIVAHRVFEVKRFKF